MTNPDIEQPLIPSQASETNGHARVTINDESVGANPRSRKPHATASTTTASQGSLRHHLHMQMQREHNVGVGDGGLRAAVFGFLDGLVSNLCLILGVFAAVSNGDTSVQTLLLTGLSGLMAGAASMSTGEW